MTIGARNIPGDAEKKGERVRVLVGPAFDARHHLLATIGAAVELRFQAQRQAALAWNTRTELIPVYSSCLQALLTICIEHHDGARQRLLHCGQARRVLQLFRVQQFHIEILDKERQVPWLLYCMNTSFCLLDSVRFYCRTFR